jgi:hypothetical protein
MHLHQLLLVRSPYHSILERPCATLLLRRGSLLHLHVLKVLLLLRVSMLLLLLLLLLLMVLPKLTLLLRRQVAMRLRSTSTLSRHPSSSTFPPFLNSLLTTQLLAFVIAAIGRRGRGLLLALLCLLYRRGATKQAVLRQYLDL